MKRYTNFIAAFITTLLLLLSSPLFAKDADTNKKMPTPGDTSLISGQMLTQKLKHFSSLNCLGHVDIKILRVGNNLPASISMPSKSKSLLNVFVKGKTLTIRQKKATGTNAAIPLIIRVHRLSRIQAYDATSITAKDFNAKQLSISTNNSGSIKIDGKVGLQRITAAGPGIVNIRWIDTKSLVVSAKGGAKIKLAGVAQQMRARLTGHSELDGQYLRCQHVIVQTRKYAQAKVTAIKTLRAFALGNSNVYYYKNPEKISRYTSSSGSILQLDWRR